MRCHGRPRPRGHRNDFVRRRLSTPCRQAADRQRPRTKAGGRPATTHTAPQGPEAPAPTCPTAEGDGSGADGPLASAAVDPPRSPAVQPGPIARSRQPTVRRRTHCPGHNIPPAQCGRSSPISRRSSPRRGAAGPDAAASPSSTTSPAAAGGPNRDWGWEC